MTSIFSKLPGLTSRYSLEGASHVIDVLNSSSPLNDELLSLDYQFEQRIISRYSSPNTSRLTTGMDILQLQLYWMEFCGDGDRARKDVNFLAKRLMGLTNRMNSRYENRVLVAFCKIDFLSVRLVRKGANDWWKSAFKKTSLDTSSRTGCEEYRLYRINALKKVCGEEWENYIWRILDIDDIGEYFNHLIPAYRAHEEAAKLRVDW